MKLNSITLLSAITCSLIAVSSNICSAQPLKNVLSGTPGNPNYIGIGATTDGVAAYSKFSLSDQFSLRPMIFFDDLGDDFNGTVIVPVTYDFELANTRAKPFVGIGGGSQTRDFDIGLEFTTGLDYQINRRLTATGLFNVQLFDDNDINAVVGLGFNF